MFVPHSIPFVRCILGIVSIICVLSMAPAAAATDDSDSMSNEPMAIAAACNITCDRRANEDELRRCWQAKAACTHHVQQIMFSKSSDADNMLMRQKRSTFANPDAYFLDCCQQMSEITKSCFQFCSYSHITDTTLMQMATGAPCPSSAMGAYLFCAGANHDHTDCCRRAHVDTDTEAGSKCLALCNLNPDHDIVLDNTHYPCLGLVQKYGQCYQSYVQTEIKAGRLG